MLPLLRCSCTPAAAACCPAYSSMVSCRSRAVTRPPCLARRLASRMLCRAGPHLQAAGGVPLHWGCCLCASSVRRRRSRGAAARWRLGRRPHAPGLEHVLELAAAAMLLVRLLQELDLRGKVSVAERLVIQGGVVVDAARRLLLGGARCRQARVVRDRRPCNAAAQATHAHRPAAPAPQHPHASLPAGAACAIAAAALRGSGGTSESATPGSNAVRCYGVRHTRGCQAMSTWQ
jgi:hypothetical protein